MTVAAQAVSPGALQEPRWLVRRKAEAAAAAVRAGATAPEDACRRYGVTLDQLAACQRAVERSVRRPTPPVRPFAFFRLPLRRFS